MIMGYTAMGEKMATDSVSSVSNITKIDISNAAFDDLYVTKLTENNSEQVLPPNEWVSGTYSHAKFNGTIYAGNTEFGVNNTSNVLVKRRKAGEFKWMTIYDQIATCADDYTFVAEDPYAPAGKLEYAIVPIINGLESEYIIKDIEYSFDGIMLLEKDKLIWTLADISISEQKNGPVGIVNTLQGKYPYAFSNGDADYFTGTVSATFFDTYQFIQRGFIDNLSFDGNLNLHKHYANIMEFLNNKKPKILKYDDGKVRMIMVTTPPTDSSDEHYDKHTIEFSFTEIGDPYSNEDMNNYSFIELDAERWVR